MTMHLSSAAKLLIACFVLACAMPTSIARANTVQDCQIGSYRLKNGSGIEIDPDGDNFLRWRAFTGETGQLSKQPDGSWASTYGWTGRADGKTVSFSDCDKGEIRFGKES